MEMTNKKNEGEKENPHAQRAQALKTKHATKNGIDARLQHVEEILGLI